MRLCERSTEQLEARLRILYKELARGSQHPDYPWIDKIPGYQAASEEIDAIEDILDRRGA